MNAWFTRKASSAQNAKDRLRLVLIQDRTSLTSSELEELKNELLMVLAKYVTFDPSLVRIGMTQEGREQRLTADIPIMESGKRKRN